MTADTIHERHHIGPSAYGQDYCDFDGKPWPCDTAIERTRADPEP